MQDIFSLLGIYPQLIHCGRLVVEDRLIPAAREKTGVSSEKQAINTGHIQSATVDRQQIEGLILHPVITAGSIQVDIGTQVSQHKHFTQESSSEVRNDKPDEREMKSDG